MILRANIHDFEHRAPQIEYDTAIMDLILDIPTFLLLINCLSFILNACLQRA